MTPRSFKSDFAFKDAVEARVRGHAVKHGVNMKHVRQLLVFDRLLVRLHEVFGPRVLVKGGVVLETRTLRARATKDLDVSLTGDVSAAHHELAAAAAYDADDRLDFEVRALRHGPKIHGPGALYGGSRFTVTAFLSEKPYGDPFGLDVVFGYLQSGEPDLLLGRAYLEPLGFPPPVLRVTNRETHIAEKLHAYSMPTERDNSRVKDLPDIAILASIGPLESRRVQEALALVFSVRHTHPMPLVVPSPPAWWAVAYGNMARANGLAWPSLQAVSDATSRFLDPALAGVAGVWNPTTWSWELG